MRLNRHAWAMVLALGPLGVHAAGLVDDLRSPLPTVRRQAAIELGRAGDRTGVPALIAALSDTDKGVRREAAKALGAIKDARAADALIQALDDRDTNVRAYAAYALGEIKEPKAAPGLLRALKDADYCVRDEAAWALRGLHDADLVVPLTRALAQEDADAVHIAWILRQTADAHTIDALGKLLKDSTPLARVRAVQILGQIGKPETLPPLVAALEDADPKVRIAAVEALVKMRDERAKKPLQALIAREQDAAVRDAAQKAMKILSQERDLMAYWSFDDKNTKIAKDFSEHGNDGEIKGCTPVKGKVGYALAFSKGKFVELGKPRALPLANVPLTIMAWVKSDADRGVVVARGGAFCGFSLFIKDGLPKFGIQRIRDKPSIVAVGPVPVVGKWVHLAGVVKRNRVELYVNGKLAAATKSPGYIPSNAGQGMEIGFDVANSPIDIVDNFEGIIDEVKVYRAALSAKDIAKQCSGN